ncbi:MAG TPA: isoprenylcysteine carboxylmethyltransferase family protein [Anaerolineaceae bacterium]|nr:isoprenylcysteine carboxylmethyltransferase family protein [Anaerolineaceae bacterium]
MPQLTRKQVDPPSGKFSMRSLLPNLLAVLLGLGVLLFFPAGRLDWIQAWAFILAFGGFLTFYGLWVVRNDPGQITERSHTGQNTKTWDKAILAVYTLLLLAMLILAGLDASRFRWAVAPLALQILGWLGAAFAGFVIFRTAGVNTYLSRTVRIQDDRGQKVIDTGPYARVRHPMYLGVIILMVSIPLLLGSLWALIPGGLIGILFIFRTALEDRTLFKELSGYSDYASRVRYRLIPGIW